MLFHIQRMQQWLEVTHTQTIALHSIGHIQWPRCQPHSCGRGRPCTKHLEQRSLECHTVRIVSPLQTPPSSKTKVSHNKKTISGWRLNYTEAFHMLTFHGFFEDKSITCNISELCKNNSLLELHKRRKARLLFRNTLPSFRLQ